jgi:hypothetical protein
MTNIDATQYLQAMRADRQNQALFESSPQFDAFIAGIDWLQAGNAGEFGRLLGQLADECSLDQLGRLMICFAPAFNEAMVKAQLQGVSVQ